MLSTTLVWFYSNPDQIYNGLWKDTYIYVNDISSVDRNCLAYIAFIMMRDLITPTTGYAIWLCQSHH